MAGLGRKQYWYGGISCPRCRQKLREEQVRTGPQTCPWCGGGYTAVRFSAPEAKVVLPELAGVGPAAGAPCARHARNQADHACSRCGQFMCSLCRIDADGQAYCPPCYERLTTEQSLSAGITRSWNWPGLAAFSILISWIPPLTLFLPAFAWIVGIVFCVLGLKEKKARNESDGVVALIVLILINLLSGLGGVAVLVGLFGGFKS